MIAAWVVLTLVGGVAAGKLSTRWYQSTAVPGKPAYEGSLRTLKALGVGQRPPNIVVFHSPSVDVTKSAAVRAAMARVVKANPDALTSSYFSTGNAMYVSRDRHTTFLQVYPPGANALNVKSGAAKMRAEAAHGLPAGITVNVTGYQPLEEATKLGSSGGSSVLLEGLIGGLGALVILLFVFGTLPAVLMPLVVAVAAILNTFTLVWALTYITDVSIIVQFLIVLVGLGVAIDYALLMVFRFRDELREGNDVESALVETMTHAGHSVIVSGTTVAVGLLSMIVLPLPLLRAMGIGGMLIPVVSVLASLTLLPAMLAVLGQRVNSVRVMPRRLVDSGHPEDGAWGRWARFVLRRPAAVAAVGVAIVARARRPGNAAEPERGADEVLPRHRHGDRRSRPARRSRDHPRRDQAARRARRARRQRSADRGEAARRARNRRSISAAGMASWAELVRRGVRDRGRRRPRHPGDDRPRQREPQGNRRDADRHRRGRPRLPARPVRQLPLRARPRPAPDTGPAHAGVPLDRTGGQGGAAEPPLARRLVRDHRLHLPGGSRLLALEPPATQSITAYIPVMIFAFLFGLSMDYEVFMLSRMREAYDETGSTDKAIELGLARTGKLVTSAALILMFAFLVLSSSPGYEVKSLAIGLAAGIIFDATVIRALLVPALMKLLGDCELVDAEVDGDRSPRPAPEAGTRDRDRDRIAAKSRMRTSSDGGGETAPPPSLTGARTGAHPRLTQRKRRG